MIKMAPEPGKDAFHRVPRFPGEVRDAVERVLTTAGGAVRGYSHFACAVFLGLTLAFASGEDAPQLTLQEAHQAALHSHPQISVADLKACLLYTSPSPRDGLL